MAAPLTESPATFHVTAPHGSSNGPFELTRTRWGSLIRSLLISPAGAAQVPYPIHLIHQGECDPWMPNARRILVREGHHNFRLDECGRVALATFFETADPFNLDAAWIAAGLRLRGAVGLR